MPKSYADLLAIGTTLAGLLSLSPAVAEQAKAHHHMFRTDHALRFPKGWPKQIPIYVGKKTYGSQVLVYIKGPEYWASLSPATRSRLNTFRKLQRYCQTHEGNG